MSDTSRTDVPLFPLGTVLYPGGRLPLRIFEPRYVDMVGECLREERAFGVVPIVSGSEAGGGAEFHPAGTLARITAFDRGDDGLLHLVAQGTERFRVITHNTRTDGLVRADVSLCGDAPGVALPRHDDLRRLLQQVFSEHAEIAPPQPWAIDDDDWVAYRFAELLPLAPATRFALLETDSPSTFLDRFRDVLNEAESPDAGNTPRPPPATH